jgi:hypothetical protein
MVPAGGLWLIEECEASSVNGMLELHLGGLGWKWVEQEHYENIVQQYVYFSATMDLEGSLQLGYDGVLAPEDRGRRETLAGYQTLATTC